MARKFYMMLFASVFLFACATTGGVQTPTASKGAPKELKIELKSVSLKLGADKILSGKLLVAQKLAKTLPKSKWLTLLGMGADKKMGPVELPKNVLLATVPKADLTVTFEVSNPNDFDVVIGSISFGLSEETILLFPAKSKTEEVWIDVFANETTEFEVPMTIQRIPSLASIAWPAVETGTAKWKARGTAVVIAEAVPFGGQRQRFETQIVSTDMVKGK